MSARGVALMLAVLAMAVAGTARSQQVWRSVAPDGRVIFSDVPPRDAGARPETPQAGAAADDAALPYALRQVTERFPVVLYTGSDCAPCTSGRALLRARGIPFTERTVSTEADVLALQRLAGDRSLPLITVGRQQIKGFNEPDWQQYLDAAGYPRTSALPATWRPAAPTPLVAQSPAAAPAATPQAAPAPSVAPVPVRPAVPPPARSSTNPAGIQF